MNIENLKFEKNLVHNTYDQIANKFNLTRLYIWPCVKTFLNSLNNNDLIADIGCGSGRNLSIIGQKHDNNDINKREYSENTPSTNVYEDEWSYRYELATPGFTKKDLTITLKESNLEIKEFDTSCFSGEYVTDGVNENYLDKLSSTRLRNNL